MFVQKKVVEQDSTPSPAEMGLADVSGIASLNSMQVGGEPRLS